MTILQDWAPNLESNKTTFILQRQIFSKAKKDSPESVVNQEPEQMVTAGRLFYTIRIILYSGKTTSNKMRLFVYDFHSFIS